MRLSVLWASERFVRAQGRAAPRITAKTRSGFAKAYALLGRQSAFARPWARGALATPVSNLQTVAI